MTRIALLLILAMFTAPAAWAQETELDALFDELRSAQAGNWERIEDRIWAIWSQSGSAGLDFLLTRGREAMAEEDYGAAIEHLTVLVETAPDFAEGWNARATAYYQAGLVGPALADIGKALTLEPRHFGALSGLGLILEETGDSEAAIRAYEAALAIHPHRPDLREAIDRLEEKLQGETI